MPVRILLVDDHRIVREGLRILLTNASADEVQVREAENGLLAIAEAARFVPDVVVMDLAMPILNGIDATRQILSDHPATRVVVLSALADRHVIADAFRAGAVAYVAKEAAFEELGLAIRKVLDGKVYISPDLADVVREAIVASKDDGAASSAHLTSRERETIQLIAEGKTTKQIAQVLKISVKTVETHRRGLMDKLQIFNVADLTKFALRERLTSLDG
jgi:DNA-binding NarL/FixJ family response regulator